MCLSRTFHKLAEGVLSDEELKRRKQKGIVDVYLKFAVITPSITSLNIDLQKVQLKGTQRYDPRLMKMDAIIAVNL